MPVGDVALELQDRGDLGRWPGVLRPPLPGLRKIRLLVSERRSGPRGHRPRECRERPWRCPEGNRQGWPINPSSAISVQTSPAAAASSKISENRYPSTMPMPRPMMPLRCGPIRVDRASPDHVAGGTGPVEGFTALGIRSARAARTVRPERLRRRLCGDNTDMSLRTGSLHVGDHRGDVLVRAQALESHPVATDEAARIGEVGGPAFRRPRPCRTRRPRAARASSGSPRPPRPRSRGCRSDGAHAVCARPLRSGDRRRRRGRPSQPAATSAGSGAPPVLRARPLRSPRLARPSPPLVSGVTVQNGGAHRDLGCISAQSLIARLLRELRESRRRRDHP